MILIVLPALVLIIYIIYIVYEIFEYGFRFLDGEEILGVIVSVIIAFIVSSIIYLIATVVPGKGHITNVKSQNLYALQDNFNTSGSYFLGCGSVKSDLHYYYVYMTEDGGYKIGDIPAENTIIYYTDKDYRLDTVYFEFDNIIHRFLGKGYIERRFYIPQDSILQNYSIDLE